MSFALCNISDSWFDDLDGPAVGVEITVTTQNQILGGSVLAFSSRTYRSNTSGVISFSAAQGSTIVFRTTGPQEFTPYPVPMTVLVPLSATATLSSLTPITSNVPSPNGFIVQSNGTPLADRVNTMNFVGTGVTVTETAGPTAQVSISGAVSSVFGRIGAVVAQSGDYSFSQLSGSIAVAQVAGGSGASSSTFFRGDNTWATVPSALVTSVFGRTGAVVAASSDYAFSQLSGNIATTQMNSGTGASSSTFWRGDGSWAAISAAVSSVSNSDSTLTVSPTSGNVVASLNLGNANTWTAKQTFDALAFALGSDATGDLYYRDSGGATARLGIGTSNYGLVVSGGLPAWAAMPSSVSNSDGTLTISPTTGSVVASLALGHANTWTAAQTFGANDLIAASLQPATDSTTAFQVFAANGSTVVANFDTTNSRIGLNGNVVPVATIDFGGAKTITTIPNVNDACTISSTTSGTKNGWLLSFVTAGSGTGGIIGVQCDLQAGYTGSALTRAISAATLVAGTGTWAIGGLAANNAIYGLAAGTTTGDNIGLNGEASGGAHNIGVWGWTPGNVSGPNVGVIGTALSNASTVVGGAFSCGDSSVTIANLTGASAGVVIDVGTSGNPYIIGQQRGTSKWQMTNAGNLQLAGGVLDANSNPMFALTSTASAVYGFTFTNAALAGTPAIGVTAPAVAATSTAGTPLSLSASAAVAGNVTAGAAAGGAITLTAGAAARLTSGNANGGNVVVVGGAGIGTGATGILDATGTLMVVGPAGSASAPAFSFSGNTTTGIYGGTALIALSMSGTEKHAFTATLAELQTIEPFGVSASSNIGASNGYWGDSFIGGVNSVHGEYVKFTSASTTVSSATGATITATNLIPAGAIVLGVDSRVTTAFSGGTVTAISIGDGTTATQWSNASAITLGATTNSTNYITTWTPRLYSSATSVVVTSTGTFGATGVIRLTVYYWLTSAPTS